MLSRRTPKFWAYFSYTAAGSFGAPRPGFLRASYLVCHRREAPSTQGVIYHASCPWDIDMAVCDCRRETRCLILDV